MSFDYFDPSQVGAILMAAFSTGLLLGWASVIGASTLGRKRRKGSKSDS